MKVKTITTENAVESLGSIFPMYKISMKDGIMSQIGSAFFINAFGLIVSAKHVIEENMDLETKDTKNSKDIGGIGILCLEGLNRKKQIYRPLLNTVRHPYADISVSTTQQYVNEKGEQILDMPLHMTTLSGKDDEEISTLSFHKQGDPDIIKAPLVKMEGQIDISIFPHKESEHKDPARQIIYPAASITTGKIRKYWPRGTDKIMRPFPVYETDMPIYSGNSGGPVFNSKGAVIGINHSSGALDISYAVDIRLILDLHVEDTFMKGDLEPKRRTIIELIKSGVIPMEGSDEFIAEYYD